MGHEEALRALLQVDPDALPVEPIEEKPPAPRRPEKEQTSAAVSATRAAFRMVQIVGPVN